MSAGFLVWNLSAGGMERRGDRAAWKVEAASRAGVLPGRCSATACCGRIPSDTFGPGQHARLSTVCPPSLFSLRARDAHMHTAPCAMDSDAATLGPQGRRADESRESTPPLAARAPLADAHRARPPRMRRTLVPMRRAAHGAEAGSCTIPLCRRPRLRRGKGVPWRRLWCSACGGCQTREPRARVRVDVSAACALCFVHATHE